MKKRKKHRSTNLPRFKTEPDIIKDPKLLSVDDEFQFECICCGECCRNVEQSVLVESLDLYRIAGYLRQNDHSIKFIEDVIEKYLDMKLMSESIELPLFFMKTRGAKKECIFLQGNRCSIHPVKPRACRCYPLNPWPKATIIESGYTDEDGFDYAILSAKKHHFLGPAIKVRDWMKATCDEMDRDFIIQDVRVMMEIAPIMQSLHRANVDSSQILLPLFMYKYFSFELDKPFMLQYKRNMEMLIRALSEIYNAGRKSK